MPLFAVAILKTSVAPRWIGWLGIFVGVFAGLATLLRPASNVIAEITSVGFVAFFLFMASMGVALLRRRPGAEELRPVSAQ